MRRYRRKRCFPHQAVACTNQNIATCGVSRCAVPVMLSPCLSRGRLFCRLAVLHQRLSSSCLTPPRASAGARAQNIARAPGRERECVARRRGAGVTRRTWRSPWCGSSPDAGNSKWGAGNLLTSAPSGPFVSGRTHTSSLLSTASSRSACHPIATG
jgi:hypothetical protein